MATECKLNQTEYGDGIDVRFNDGGVLGIHWDEGNSVVTMSTEDLHYARFLGEILNEASERCGTEGYPFYSDCGLARGFYEIAKASQSLEDFINQAQKRLVMDHDQGLPMEFESLWSVTEGKANAFLNVAFANGALAEVCHICTVWSVRLGDALPETERYLEGFLNEIAADTHGEERKKFLQSIGGVAENVGSPELWLEALRSNFSAPKPETPKM